MSTIDYRDPSLLATSSSNGLMSLDDKAKLNGIGPVIDGYATTTSLQTETNRAIDSETRIRVLVDGYALKTSLLAEISRSTITDSQIKTALDGYTTKTYVDGYASSIKASITAETNRAIAAESQIRQALDGYGGTSATDGYAKVTYVDGYVSASVLAETNRAMTEEGIIKVALDGYVLIANGDPFSMLQATGGIGLSVFEGVATLTAEYIESLVGDEYNRAIAEENIIKIALDGYTVEDGYTTKAYVDGYAATIEGLVQAESDRAIAEENVIKNALDGYVGNSITDGYATIAYVDGYVSNAINLRLGTRVVSSDGYLSSETPVNILEQSLVGYNLGNNKAYNCTLDIRVVIWSFENKADSGSMDTVVDGYISTDEVGDVTVAIQTTPLLDKSRLNPMLTSATFTVSPSSNGFTIAVSRPSELACYARCNWTVVAFEDIT